MTKYEVAIMVEKAERGMRMYLVLTWFYSIIGFALCIWALHKPVDWHLILGVYTLIRGAVAEQKRDILVRERDDLLKYL